MSDFNLPSFTFSLLSSSVPLSLPPILPPMQDALINQQDMENHTENANAEPAAETDAAAAGNEAEAPDLSAVLDVSSVSPTTFSSFPSSSSSLPFLARLAPDSPVDVWDIHELGWRKAKVLSSRYYTAQYGIGVSHPHHYKGKEFLVRYINWNSKWDEVRKKKKKEKYNEEGKKE